MHGRSPERGAETVQTIENGGGKARFVAADLSRADEVRRLADEAGPVDILINNAGVYRFGATVDTDDAFFDEHVNLNLRAPYILVQKLVPGMVERGHGAVVNISTVAASTPARQAGIYGATKAGVELLTRVWADEFGRSGVRVNTVSAGPTRRRAPRSRPGSPTGSPPPLRWAALPLPTKSQRGNVLVSPAASYVNGAVLHATGGRRSRRSVRRRRGRRTW